MLFFVLSHPKYTWNNMFFSFLRWKSSEIDLEKLLFLVYSNKFFNILQNLNIYFVKTLYDKTEGYLIIFIVVIAFVKKP